MKKIGCSKRKTWCEEENGIIYCENCGGMYDSNSHCTGVEFIYEETEEEKELNRKTVFIKEVERLWNGYKSKSNTVELVRGLANLIDGEQPS